MIEQGIQRFFNTAADKIFKIMLIIPAPSEPSVRTLRATIPENESH